MNPPHILLSMTLLNGSLMGQVSNRVSQSPRDALEMLEASEPSGGWDFPIYTYMSSSLVSEKHCTKSTKFSSKMLEKEIFSVKGLKILN